MGTDENWWMGNSLNQRQQAVLEWIAAGCKHCKHDGLARPFLLAAWSWVCSTFSQNAVPARVDVDGVCGQWAAPVVVDASRPTHPGQAVVVMAISIGDLAADSD